jgi:hypothetical protein
MTSPFVSGTDYISNTTDVRELSGSVISAQFPDDEIIEEQVAAYSDVCIFTHKFDWDADDPEFYSIQKAEAQLAKAYIMEHYGGPTYNNVVKETRFDVYKKLEEIKDNMITVSDDEGETITRTDYNSPNLNPDAVWSSKLEQSLRSDVTPQFE